MKKVTIKKARICTGCGRVLPLTNEYFNNNKAARGGLETKCKRCMKEVKLKRYKNQIYEMYCIRTDKYYIGQTIKPLNDRISKHFSDAKRGREQPLYEDIRRYGRDGFTYKELEYVPDRNDLDDKEKYWIGKYKTEGKILYNRETGGRSGDITTKEVREKMAESKGRKPFYVFTYDKEFVGEFNNSQEVNRILGTTTCSQMLSGKQKHFGNYIAIYKDDYTEEKLDEIVSRLFIDCSGNVRTYCDVSGDKNPMSKKNRIAREQQFLNLREIGKEVSLN